MRDRLLLMALGAVPTALAKHVMFLLRSNPSIADRWEHHVRPIHFYEPLPDFREITPAAAGRRRPPQAMAIDIPAQLALVTRLAATFGTELETMASAPAATGFDFGNGYFGGLDAAVYYALVRDLKPRRIIEIGSGFSTRIASAAAGRNAKDGRPAEVICVEPYPQPRLVDARLPVTIVQERVEHLSFDLFEALQPNDILFIDSSHTVKFGGDVCREFLEILPRLKPGVWIHVHDIFFPYDYPPEWLIERRYAWTEQYLLEAFLAFNHDFTTACALRWLWCDHREALQAAWPRAIAEASTHGPASFWMRRVG